MRLQVRIHEWLADRISWVQYPKVRPAAPVQASPSLWRQYRNLRRKQRAWVWFGLFWGSIAVLIALTADW